MATTSRNFVAGKMNKGLDERLLPNGQYIDAVNVRLGSTETTEIGAVENSKGNEQITSLQYNGTALSSQATCIGAYALGEQETMFWFVHDPAFGQGATGKCDMIVSFETTSQTLEYHIISIDDGGGVNTTLNFQPRQLVLGVDFVDNLLFFTDNFNPPRFININRNYNNPSVTFIDQFSAESILVIKRPPFTAPLITSLAGGQNNYLEDRFVCFGYRYKYADNEYSATSPFSPPSFIPGPFSFSSSSFLNQGMLNTTNIAEISYHSGGPLVLGIDLLFKDMNTGTIKVIEKLIKADVGIPDNSIEVYTFSNSKIFTVLSDNEIFRTYDNVPLLAKAQTLMGNRLMYGNYFEGYDLVDREGQAIKLEYTTEQINTPVEFESLEVSTLGGTYTIAGGSSVSIPNTILRLDLSDVELVAGASLAIELDLVHNSWDASGAQLTQVNTNVELVFNYIFTQDYNSVQDLINDAAFLDAIQLLEPVFLDACNGSSYTDEFNCALQLTLDTNFDKTGSGINGINEPFFVGSEAPANPEVLLLQINAAQYTDNTDPANPIVAYEYLEISLAEAEYTKVANAKSLKSNRGYEVGIIYLDEFSRATTALVSPNNTQYIDCSESTSQNSIRVTIPPTQIPPSFAKYYKLCIKADKDDYNVIYTNLFFQDLTLGSTWFLLEGENSQKIEAGDKLIVKADTNGPKARCTEVTVLDKEAKTQDFINPPPVDAANNEAIVPAGTYMRIATNQIATELGDNPVIKDDQGGRGNDGSCPKVFLKVCSLENPDYDSATYDPLDPTTFAFIDADIPEGSIMEIKYFNIRRGGNGNRCELRECIWETRATASQNYPSVKSWWDGDNIFGLTSQAECRTDTSDAPSEFSYDSSMGTFNANTPTGGTTSNNLGCEFSFNRIRFLQYNGSNPDISGQIRLGMSGTKGCGSNRNRRSTMDVEITIIRSNTLIVFESLPKDALPDLWYESPKTYQVFDRECEIRITVDTDEPSPLVFDYTVDGTTFSVTVNPGETEYVFGDCGSAVTSAATVPDDPANIDIDYTPLQGAIHQGNVQNQTPTLPAIIDTAFFNCYSFGNGVESFKIQDSIIGKPLVLGNRTTSTSAQDYKEAHRFADITYSGVINDESNVNKLNEFNLGLLNFKPLEDSYGPITVLDGRETDILVLQEDKISYVLQGKNLLSDSTGGGAIASVPEVLGTQIARIEEYGNSNNPESYAVWGSNKFFTDAKRGAVLQLKGSSAQSEQLAVISETGMRSYFRDYFINNFNTFKLGGYDPYMDEYVLNNSSLQIPVGPLEINCGVTRQFVWNGQQDLPFNYQLGNLVGPVEITITISNFGGVNIPILAVYNGANIINQTFNSNGTTVVQFNKNIVSAEELFLTVEQCAGVCVPQAVNIEITVTCPDAPLIEIFQIAVTSSNEAGQLIHDEYRWTDGTFTSALQSEQIIFGNGTGIIVSQYTSTQATQGGNLVPANNATVRIISNKIPADGDDYTFDVASNQFKFLRSSTLYTNSPSQIQALLTASSLATPIQGGGNTFEATFTMPNTSDDKLYLIWDYRKPTFIELCYSDVSVEEACCDCDGDPVPDANRFANLCYDPNSTISGKNPIPTQVIIPPTSGVTAGTFITTTSYPACTYLVGVETQNASNAQVSGIVQGITDCNQVCNSYYLVTNSSSGSITYKDCNGQVQNLTLTSPDSATICAREISTINGLQATFDCGCNLTLEVQRCQIITEPQTIPPPIEYIAYDGVTMIGDFITLTSQAYANCVWEVIGTSTNAITETKLGNASEQNCDEVCVQYFVENPSTQEPRTFFYINCAGDVATTTISPTGVAAICMRSYTASQDLNFNVSFYNCGCNQ